MEPLAAPTPQLGAVRQCANIKSRKNPDVQCPLLASHGDYCSRHTKNPRPFKPPAVQPVADRVYTRADHAAATKLQRFWRTWAPRIASRRQGPAATDRSISNNATELYTLEPLARIPALFLFSFADDRRQVWSFDIRSLSQLFSIGQLTTNPYTREPIPTKALAAIRARLDWLRKRKYATMHTSGDVLTQEQLWNQKVLDVFMKLDALGYYVSCDWFHGMTIVDHRDFYKYMYQLWYWRLGLSMQDRDLLVPGHATGSQKLFRWAPEQMIGGAAAKKHWWEKVNLALIQTFLTGAAEKERQRLGAMYIVMGLVHVSADAARAFPWVTDI